MLSWSLDVFFSFRCLFTFGKIIKLTTENTESKTTPKFCKIIVSLCLPNGARGWGGGGYSIAWAVANGSCVNLAGYSHTSLFHKNGKGTESSLFDLFCFISEVLRFSDTDVKRKCQFLAWLLRLGPVGVGGGGGGKVLTFLSDYIIIACNEAKCWQIKQLRYLVNAAGQTGKSMRLLTFMVRQCSKLLVVEIENQQLFILLPHHGKLRWLFWNWNDIIWLVRWSRQVCVSVTVID